MATKRTTILTHVRYREIAKQIKIRGNSMKVAPGQKRANQAKIITQTHSDRNLDVARH